MSHSQVFANSNSLPISLVLSLSQTISGLHWNKIPGDNDDEVAARGILYLLIFQQLGQLLRWSWGINVLLKKPDEDDTAEDQGISSRLERGQGPCPDPEADEYPPLVADGPNDSEYDRFGNSIEEAISDQRPYGRGSASSSRSEPAFESGEQTPVTNRRYTSSISSKGSSGHESSSPASPDKLQATPANGNILPSCPKLPTSRTAQSSDEENRPRSQWRFSTQCHYLSKRGFIIISRSMRTSFTSMFRALPRPLKKILAVFYAGLGKMILVMWNSMNPPLLAMGAALLVASIPSLQRLFFSDGTFVNNSITSAIRQSGGVAVPLILVVLGANLARGSQWQNGDPIPSDDSKLEKKLLVASLLCRMVFPTIFMGSLLAIAAKYIPISILDDPIFVIVCFLLAGAPSALQLAQICQINDVYMGAMTRILFHSYVIWYVFLLTPLSVLH